MAVLYSVGFRGLGPVSDKVAWVAGSRATVLRTVNGGDTWESVGPSLPDEDAALEFRDVQAFSADKAIVLSIGEGTDSRMYLTTDGGKSWTLVFQNDEPAAFYNCLDFESRTRGLAVSDPVDGKFRLVETTDGGETWEVVDSSGMPDAWPGEYQFSASGTCLSTASGRWHIASGGLDPGRVWSSDDGYHWTAKNASIAGNESGGVFSVQFRSKRHGIALGGDFEDPAGSNRNAALSLDGGRTWKSARKLPSGYRSGSTFLPVLPNVAFAVGPTGSDWSIDGGYTWHGFDNGSFHAVECVKPWACWASGESGRVAKLTL
ncbi:oxidoreductase [Sarocladium strictum]